MILHDTLLRTVIDTVYLQNSSNDVEIIKDIVEISNSSISCQITTLNAFIAGFSLVFVIAGIIFGIYISNLEKKVVKIKESIDDKEKEIITLAKTVKDTDEKIQSDISGLYTKLRDEESITLLKRLVEEPLDINNICELLLARQLKPDWFTYIKTAFYKLLDLGDVANEHVGFNPSYKQGYLIVIFQHYMYYAINDDVMRKEIHPLLVGLIDNEFKRDIIKTTEDFCLALSEKNCTFDRRSILVEFLTALNNSKYRELPELRKIFEEKISDKDLLPEAIEKCTSDNIYLSLFGIESPQQNKQ